MTFSLKCTRCGLKYEAEVTQKCIDRMHFDLNHGGGMARKVFEVPCAVCKNINTIELECFHKCDDGGAKCL